MKKEIKLIKREIEYCKLKMSFVKDPRKNKILNDEDFYKLEQELETWQNILKIVINNR